MFVWNPGDGNDIVEGQDGVDTLDVQRRQQRREYRHLGQRRAGALFPRRRQRHDGLNESRPSGSTPSAAPTTSWSTISAAPTSTAGGASTSKARPARASATARRTGARSTGPPATTSSRSFKPWRHRRHRCPRSGRHLQCRKRRPPRGRRRRRQRYDRRLGLPPEPSGSPSMAATATHAVRRPGQTRRCSGAPATTC